MLVFRNIATGQKNCFGKCQMSLKLTHVRIIQKKKKKKNINKYQLISFMES